MTNLGLFAAGPDFEYPLPELEGCPPARPVAELSGPPDDIAFPAPAGADTEPGKVHGHCFICAQLLSDHVWSLSLATTNQFSYVCLYFLSSLLYSWNVCPFFALLELDRQHWGDSSLEYVCASMC